MKSPRLFWAGTALAMANFAAMTLPLLVPGALAQTQPDCKYTECGKTMVPTLSQTQPDCKYNECGKSSAYTRDTEVAQTQPDCKYTKCGKSALPVTEMKMAQTQPDCKYTKCGKSADHTATQLEFDRQSENFLAQIADGQTQLF